MNRTAFITCYGFHYKVEITEITEKAIKGNFLARMPGNRKWSNGGFGMFPWKDITRIVFTN